MIFPSEDLAPTNLSILTTKMAERSRLLLACICVHTGNKHKRFLALALAFQLRCIGSSACVSQCLYRL